MTDDVLGFGGDPKEDFHNPFADETTDDESDTGDGSTLGDGIEEDEEIDLRKVADTGDESDEGDEGGESESDETDEEKQLSVKIAEIKARYKNNPDEMAKAIVHAQRVIGRQGQKLAGAETQDDDKPSDSQTQELPKVGPNGFPTDEYGLEKIPTAFFATRQFESRVAEHLEKPTNLIGYLVQSGMSEEDARDEARLASEDPDLFNRYVKTMMDDYKSSYQENYKRARQEKESEAEVQLTRESAKLQQEQVEECKRQRAKMAETLGLSGDAANRVTVAVHNAAVRAVADDVKSGKLSKKEQFDPKIVETYYARGLAEMVRTGEYAKVVRGGTTEENKTGVKTPDRKAQGTQEQSTQTQQAKVPDKFGTEAEQLFVSLKRQKPELTREEFANRHGKTIDLRK